MKLATINALFFIAAPTAAVFHPHKTSYAELVNKTTSLNTTFAKALSETGIITITNLPTVYDKREALSSLHDCAIKSKATQEHTFADGTRRLTMATRSVPGGIQKIHHEEATEYCETFDMAAQRFRSVVAATTQAFADRVVEYFQEEELKVSLLTTHSDVTFPTFSQVVEMGEHLEHFHLYEKFEESYDDEETIELHIDQGLFIVFTPGLMIHHQDKASSSKISKGFFIELADGTIEEVAFDPEDDLVIMIGDGVNQYINDKLPGDKLRAVPHTLRMDPHQESFSRVWYGRMVLPPVDAIHPASNLTFEELRNQMIDVSLHDQEDEHVGLGCSGGMIARDLAAITCEGNSMYCWHRCMNFTVGVSEKECGLSNEKVECINPRGQIWAGKLHGDYYPACANATLVGLETPFPTLKEYPRSDLTCSNAGFEAFVAASSHSHLENGSAPLLTSRHSDQGYDHMQVLPGGGRFLWSVEDDTVRGRVAFNGLFGWIAFGFADPKGKKNGMHGANIIMALPGGDFSPKTGLNLTMGPTINQYQIHPTETSFRHWMTPLAANFVNTTKIETTDCYTAMSFETSTIGSYKFNLTGTDELIWAANGLDYFVNYHTVRSRFSIDWKSSLVVETTRAPVSAPVIPPTKAPVKAPVRAPTSPPMSTPMSVPSIPPMDDLTNPSTNAPVTAKEPTSGPSPCFSGDSTVVVLGHGVVRMRDLKIGDTVLTGENKYSTVYSFGHYAPRKQQTILQIRATNMNQPLEISPLHMLFVNEQLQQALNVKVGDRLRGVDGTVVTVQSVRTVHGRGIYAPLTYSGELVVNHVVTSCYVAQAALYGTTFKDQALIQHVAIFPYRFYCAMVSCANEQYDDEHGLPWAVALWYPVLHFLEDNTIVCESVVWIWGNVHTIVTFFVLDIVVFVSKTNRIMCPFVTQNSATMQRVAHLTMSW